VIGLTGQIIVGVDGSQPAERALVWAAETASRDGAQLLIVHCGDVLPEDARAPGDVRDYSREVLAEAVATAIEADGGGNISTLLRDEQPAQVLLELSDQARMLVVGSHGEGQIAGVLLGSVAYRVAAHARCPVVVVPENWRAPAANQARAVAVGVSGSACGQDALEFAFTEAERRDVPVLAVRSWTDTRQVERESAVQDEQQELLTRMVKTLRGRHPAVEVNTELSSEAVYDTLLAATARADLLVVGCSHDGEHRFARLGSMSARLLHASPCPVAVVGHPVATAPARADLAGEAC
jgi:nucleotide-binding universal stress UspA family protein